MEAIRDHSKSLANVVKAAKAMLPKRTEADKVLREIERQEKADAAQASSSTMGETEPEE